MSTIKIVVGYFKFHIQFIFITRKFQGTNKFYLLYAEFCYSQYKKKKKTTDRTLIRAEEGPKVLASPPTA